MTIDLKLTPRKDALLLGHNNTLDVLLRAVGPAAPEGAPARRRLNLAIVIDRSGSMEGQPLEEAKRCAKAIVGQLTADDFVSVVAYGSDVEVVCPARPASDVTSVCASIDRIDTLGMTALHDGWAAGAEQAAINVKKADVSLRARPNSSGSERASLGLSSFRTPAASAWAGYAKVRNHLRLGGTTQLCPCQQIWMLFGFELFACLKSRLKAEVIEVYPFAIVRALLPMCEHKSTEKGYRDQLAAVAARPGWAPQIWKPAEGYVPGSRHDRLDAFMAAWIASLPPEGGARRRRTAT